MNGCELSSAATLLHPILGLRLRPLQRVIRLKTASGSETSRQPSADALSELVHLVRKFNRIIGVEELPRHLSIVHRKVNSLPIP